MILMDTRPYYIDWCPCKHVARSVNIRRSTFITFQLLISLGAIYACTLHIVYYAVLVLVQSSFHWTTEGKTKLHQRQQFLSSTSGDKRKREPCTAKSHNKGAEALYRLVSGCHWRHRSNRHHSASAYGRTPMMLPCLSKTTKSNSVGTW